MNPNNIPPFSMKVLIAMCEIADPSDPRYLGTDEIADKMNVSIEQVKGALSYLETNNLAWYDEETKVVKRGKKIIRVHADNLVTPSEEGLKIYFESKAEKKADWNADDILNAMWDSH